MEKSAKQPKEASAPNKAVEPGARSQGVIPKEAASPPELGGAVAFAPARVGGKGPGMKSLPTELGAVCHLKGTFCCWKGAASCASLTPPVAGMTV